MSFLLKLLKPYLNWKINKDSQAALPNYDQNFTLQGLNKKVEIIRDKWAVAHIQAQNEQDLCFAQGFCHAQDRLWQMELWRRLSTGRLSEVFGKVSVDADRLLRTLGFHRQAILDCKRYENNPILNNAKAYAAGVNAYIAQIGKNLPAEFKLLKHKPEAWKEADSFAIARFLAFQMSWGWHHQMERAQMVQLLGLEKAQELFIKYPKENPVVLKNGIERHFWDGDLLKPLDSLYLKPIGGSNNWAVAAHKMENQSAALCNDPHLLLNNPNIWVENHLTCPEWESTGVSVAGLPFVVIGHNRKIAWGITLAFIDMQDLYVEQFTSEEFKQYYCGNEIRRATHFEEKIYIKGKKQPQVEKVIYTHHGAIISEVIDGLDKKVKLALASPVLQQHDMVLGFYRFNQANGWDDFVEACRCIAAPSLNIAYADTSDNIGYYCTGKIPIRNQDKHGLPVSGSDGKHEWVGFIPFEEMPHALNPAQGYVFSCNNKICPDNYPYDLGDLFMNGYRAERLRRLFAEKNSYNLQDFQLWQQDLYSVAAERWKPLLLSISHQVHTRKTEPVPNLFAAFKLLEDWDCTMSAGSAAAAIYQLCIQQLTEQLIAPVLGKALTAAFRGEGRPAALLRCNEFWSHDADVLLQILENPSSLWRQGSNEEMIWKAFIAAVRYLNEQVSPNVKEWAWGKIHYIDFNHALGQEPTLSEIFSLRQYPVGGDGDTLNQLSSLPNQHFGGLICGASYRQVINMGNFADCYNVVPLGQSGNKHSPHQTDQLKMWLNGVYKPMIWSREQLQEYAQHKQILQPNQ